jgi:transcriptional regulator with XRE-family HTH domain
MSNLNIEEKIKKLAKDKNLSIRQLCIKIEITESGLNYTLKNNTLKIETLQKIADVFEVPISYFFVDDNNLKTEFLTEKLKRLSNSSEIFEKANETAIEATERLIGILENKVEILTNENKIKYSNIIDKQKTISNLISTIDFLIDDILSERKTLKITNAYNALIYLDNWYGGAYLTDEIKNKIRKLTDNFSL